MAAVEMPPARMSFPRAIGHAIRARRMELDLTQSQLAKTTRTYRPLICRLERGEHWPNMLTLFSYAHALGMSLSGLIALAEEMQKGDEG